MSDKELKLKGDQNFDDLRDVWKRIEELKTKLNKAILHWSNYGDMADLIRKDNANRIEALEKKMIPNPLKLIEQFNKLEEQIAELKEQFEEHLHGEYVLREVLRELGKGLENEPKLIQSYRDIIEKLDSKTEKIPIGDDLMKRIMSHKSVPMDKTKYKKASGGENLTKGTGQKSVNGNIGAKTTEDSKLPEPKTEPEKLGKIWVHRSDYDKLIEEFLDDFVWYMAFDLHYKWFQWRRCVCKVTPFCFRDWMLEKWQGRLKK